MRILIKKAASVIFAAVMLGETASALSIDEIEAKNTLVTVTVSDESPETYITFRTVKNDIEGNELNKTAALLQEQTDNEGKAVFIFEVPNDNSRKYTVIVKNENGEKDEKTFDYIGGEQKNAALSEIKAAAVSLTGKTEKTEIAEILNPVFDKTEIRKALEGMGADIDTFSVMPEDLRSDTVYLLYIQYDLTRTNADEIAEQMNRSMGLVLYNSGDRQNGIKVFGKDLDISLGDWMEEKYTDSEKFIEEYEKAKTLKSIKAARVDRVAGLISDTADKTGIGRETIVKLNSLSDAKRNMACEYLVTALRNKTVFKAEELEALIIEAVNRADKKKTSGAGGGGGGGSKGGSGNMVSSFEVAVTPAKASVFGDMEQTAWAKEAVECLYKNGILNGDGNGNFAPGRNISREEFVKLAVLLCGFEPIEGECAFADVDREAWYTPFINTAVKYGLVQGLSKEKFGIGEPITRQDMAVMAFRTMEYLTVRPSEIRQYNEFPDENEIASYAKESVKLLYTVGVINGNGMGFAPQSNASRAEAAKIMYELWKGGLTND
ncbi:MAG: S-layer homology domain-containing protein [Clostridia bacterium]|nr:S-layer homology domain-containing protein [Clostridia bacterium]